MGQPDCGKIEKIGLRAGVIKADVSGRTSAKAFMRLDAPAHAKAAYIRQRCCCAVDRPVMQRGARNIKEAGAQQLPRLMVQWGVGS